MVFYYKNIYKMRLIRTYSDQLNDLKKLRLNEKSLSEEKRNTIKRFRDAGDYKSLLSEFSTMIDDIKNVAPNIHYDNINYDEKSIDDIDILYDNDLYIMITDLKREVVGNRNKKLEFDLFGSDYNIREIFLNISLDEKRLNKIDVNNSLPPFLRNCGLGVKIYKKIIKDFDYISSFNSNKASIWSSMVFKSLTSDTELFTFTNDDNIIIFWNEYPYDDIINKLKKFYKIPGDMVFDDDFLNRYNINEEVFREMLK